MERDHGVAHASHSLAEAVRADALRGHARSFHQQVKLVGEHFRIRKSGALAQLGKITSLRKLEFFHDAACRMSFIRQLDRRIGEGASAMISIGKNAGHFSEPSVNLSTWIARMGLLVTVPALQGLTCEFTEAFGHQLVLGGKMPVERHLVRVGRFGDRVDADSPDTVTVEQLRSRRQQPRAGRNSIAFSAV
ncbi:MAG TPA: hypothetical protein VHD36_10145 [Pirellulales bacterium]|nr:hypothetical protein [Pirellulales bacterium]